MWMVGWLVYLKWLADFGHVLFPFHRVLCHASLWYLHPSVAAVLQSNFCSHDCCYARQLNDVWPGYSWSSLDHGARRWKVAHHTTRAAFAPVVLSHRLLQRGNKLLVRQYWVISSCWLACTFLWMSCLCAT